MIGNRLRLGEIVLAALLLLPFAGCMTKRQEARIMRRPRNVVFEPTDAAPLGEGDTFRFYEYDRSGEQNFCVLQLAADARLKKRYHKNHDVVLSIMAGSAIVEVEEARYTLSAGSAAMLPRYTAYSLLPTGGEDLLAVLVYTPPFDGRDVELVE
jgi:mannose-6-phosphate isomerase-like protein (cupin superfamily)